MPSSHVRLHVDGLEDRLAPATTADLLAAAARAAAGATFFRLVATDPGWMANPAARSFVQAKLQSIVQGAQGALSAVHAAPKVLPVGTMAGLTAQALTNERLALQVGHWIGVNVAPAAPTGPAAPPPAAPPTDAGMTNTMPDPNAPNWVALGAAGLKTWDVAPGAGAPLAAGGSVTVFYTGWLAANGTKFDSRRSPAAPATFALGGLIQGWQQGLLGMKPGGIRRLFVPAALGYGAAGSPPSIPANADLVFEVKLISHT